MTSNCPFAYDQCRAARPIQNHADEEFLGSLGLSDSWIGRAFRCSYCGGYWSVDEGGKKRQRGYVKNGEWRPVRR